MTSRAWHTGCLVVIACLLAQLYNRERQPKSERFQEALLVHAKDYSSLRWLGVPIWQPVLDLWTLQETIAEVKPALLIECGTYQGGSSLFFAHLFDLMQHGRVITVDIEKQNNLSHPRITYLIGDCAGPEIVGRIRAEAAKEDGPVFVVLESDHHAAHVAKEMAAHAALVTPGSYLDSARTSRFLFTHHPKGWLRRVPESRIAHEGGKGTPRLDSASSGDRR